MARMYDKCRMCGVTPTATNSYLLTQRITHLLHLHSYFAMTYNESNPKEKNIGLTKNKTKTKRNTSIGQQGRRNYSIYSSRCAELNQPTYVSLKALQYGQIASIYSR